MNLARAAILFASAMLSVLPATAQDHGGSARENHPASTSGSVTPYAGMEKRLVKALSEQQIADLRAGRGMSLALAAELNGYPGPLHVLEFADAFALSESQRMRTKALFEEMKAETIPIGERMIVDESALDRLFAERRVTQALLMVATARIGAAQGQLRAAHLRYHLAMVDVITPAQIARYAELRGYAERGNHDH